MEKNLTLIEPREYHKIFLICIVKLLVIKAFLHGPDKISVTYSCFNFNELQYVASVGNMQITSKASKNS